MMQTDTLRADLAIIAELIEPGAKVLDIGCGDGALLAWLAANKQVDGRGIEIDPEKVYEAVATGLSVIQGDGNADLVDYPAKAYDYVVLSQALQAMAQPKQVLDELLRIGRKAIVSVPNFGHWRNRLYLALKGRMPVTKTLSFEWYDTPNIHFCTLDDFIRLCAQLDIAIEKEIIVKEGGMPSRFGGSAVLANLFGEQGVFLLSRG